MQISNASNVATLPTVAGKKDNANQIKQGVGDAGAVRQQPVALTPEQQQAVERLQAFEKKVQDGLQTLGTKLKAWAADAQARAAKANDVKA